MIKVMVLIYIYISMVYPKSKFVLKSKIQKFMVRESNSTFPIRLYPALKEEQRRIDILSNLFGAWCQIKRRKRSTESCRFFYFVIHTILPALYCCHYSLSGGLYIFCFDFCFLNLDSSFLFVLLKEKERWAWKSHTIFLYFSLSCSTDSYRYVIISYLVSSKSKSKSKK